MIAHYQSHALVNPPHAHTHKHMRHVRTLTRRRWLKEGKPKVLIFFLLECDETPNPTCLISDLFVFTHSVSDTRSHVRSHAHAPLTRPQAHTHGMKIHTMLITYPHAGVAHARTLSTHPRAHTLTRPYMLKHRNTYMIWLVGDITRIFTAEYAHSVIP
jgi:hypothetical protein